MSIPEKVFSCAFVNRRLRKRNKYAGLQRKPGIKQGGAVTDALFYHSPSFGVVPYKSLRIC